MGKNNVNPPPAFPRRATRSILPGGRPKLCRAPFDQYGRRRYDDRGCRIRYDDDDYGNTIDDFYSTQFMGSPETDNGSTTFVSSECDSSPASSRSASPSPHPVAQQLEYHPASLPTHLPPQFSTSFSGHHQSSSYPQQQISQHQYLQQRSAALRQPAPQPEQPLLPPSLSTVQFHPHIPYIHTPRFTVPVANFRNGCIYPSSQMLCNPASLSSTAPQRQLVHPAPPLQSTTQQGVLQNGQFHHSHIQLPPLPNLHQPQPEYQNQVQRQLQQLQQQVVPLQRSVSSTEINWSNQSNYIPHPQDLVPLNDASGPSFPPSVVFENAAPNIEETEEGEVDPFAQLSARTLALMDQPESEVTIYDCEYCEKTYQGKHARSIWRRHLSDKHKIPLATQPRRTRWDNGAWRCWLHGL